MDKLRKDTIILDLDHTLIHAVTVDEMRLAEHRHLAPFAFNGYYVFYRPHLKKFLEFCFRKYNRVILWTMAYRDYTEKIIADIGYSKEFHEILTCNEFPKRKDVSQIAVNSQRCWFVDDCPEIINGLSEGNIITAKPFYYYDTFTDDYLLQLIRLLDKVD